MSLFAELFNEMLMRDSGFKLYKAIVEAKSTNETKEDTKDKDKSKDGGNKEEKEKERTFTEEAAKEKKIVTVDKDLLLACSYFDLGHCGYFESKDLEDILQTMSLNLSRAQIKKLVSRVNCFT